MLLVSEEFVNATEGYRSGDSQPQETYTDDIGTLFRSCQREYGRCTGHVYVDTKDSTKKIGWVFVKRERYSDCNKFFLQETWITLHTQPDEHITQRHYHYLQVA